MTDDLLRGPKAKIKRADQHILEVKALIEAYLRADPPLITTFQELNPDGTREFLKVKMTRPIPDDAYTAVE